MMRLDPQNCTHTHSPSIDAGAVLQGMNRLLSFY
jgi:hypothetical protein